LERIKENKARLEKLLLDRALAGDIQAIEACLRHIAEDEVVEAKSTPTKAGKAKAPTPQPTS
jgi:hypothetical protein